MQLITAPTGTKQKKTFSRHVRQKVSTDPHILFKYFMSVLSLNNQVLKPATLLDPSSSRFLQTGTSW